MSGLKDDRNARGFTLVELLVAITIISILGALILGVAATATGTARESRTKSQITQLHSLLVERYDLYRTRRVELDTRDRDDNKTPDWLDRYNVERTGIDLMELDPRQVTAAGRVAALREMMKIEMPDRWSDIVGTAIPTSPMRITGRPALFLEDEPALWNTYARAYNRIVPNQPNPHINTVTGQVNTRDDILANQGAECLYLVIMNATGDGEARGLFQEADTGDTDGDGALEFLDAWGQPITYLRWAPGYESDMQLSVPGLQNTFRQAERRESRTGISGLEAIQNAVLEDHDPYDLFRLDNPDFVDDGTFNATTDVPGARGWRLVPLIVSSGPDEELGLEMGIEFDRNSTPQYTENYVAAADPYADVDPDPGIQRLGSATDYDATADNITNQQLGSLVSTQ